MALLKRLYPPPQRASTLDLEQLPPGNHILADTHSKVAGSPQPDFHECFHWERIKHLNRSTASEFVISEPYFCLHVEWQTPGTKWCLCFCVVSWKCQKGWKRKGERVTEKWNTLWKQACTSDERNPLPCQSQLLPKSATEGGKKKQPQKNSTEPTPPPFLCVPLSHTVYCKRPIPFYLEACNISVNNHFSFRCAAPSLCTQPGVVFSLFLHLKAPGVKLVTDEHWLLPQRRWKSRMKVSCALKSCTSDFPGLFKVTRQHRGTLRLILCPLSEGRLQ